MNTAPQIKDAAALKPASFTAESPRYLADRPPVVLTEDPETLIQAWANFDACPAFQGPLRRYAVVLADRGELRGSVLVEAFNRDVAVEQARRFLRVDRLDWAWLPKLSWRHVAACAHYQQAGLVVLQ